MARIKINDIDKAPSLTDDEVQRIRGGAKPISRYYLENAWPSKALEGDPDRPIITGR